MFEEYAEIGSQAGVIERFTEVGRAAAGAHVEAVGDEAGVQRVPRHAAYVAGVATAFESVEQNDLSARGAGG